jgi:hypothetical protein
VDFPGRTAVTQRCTGAAPSSTTLSFRTSVGRAKRTLPPPASMARHPSTAVPGLSVTGFLLVIWSAKVCPQGMGRTVFQTSSRTPADTGEGEAAETQRRDRLSSPMDYQSPLWDLANFHRDVPTLCARQRKERIGPSASGPSDHANAGGASRGRNHVRPARRMARYRARSRSRWAKEGPPGPRWRLKLLRPQMPRSWRAILTPKENAGGCRFLPRQSSFRSAVSRALLPLGSRSVLSRGRASECRPSSFSSESDYSIRCSPPGDL